MMIHMPKIPITARNPYGLSSKQKLVIDDMVNDIEHGKKLDAVKSTKLAYNTTNDKVIANVNSKNMSKDGFRQALIDGLSKSKIIGANSKVEQRLAEGLDALTTGKDGGEVDHKTRLAFIQEINKITGVYAPEKIDKRTLKINVDMSSEELQDKINQLQAELSN